MKDEKVACNLCKWYGFRSELDADDGILFCPACKNDSINLVIVDIRKEILDMCVEIFAHSELDFEVTLAGNGTNAFEASSVASALLNILDVSFKEIEQDVNKRVAELDEMYGY